MSFPEKVYTNMELKAAKILIDQGYKHEIIIEGKPEFVKKVEEAIELVKTAGYYEYLRTYIRKVVEIDGMTQLRQAEVTIWANKFAVGNPVDAASMFIQKSFHMQEYLDSKLYYGGVAEKRSIEKRVDFLQRLQEKSSDTSVKEECKRLLEQWKDHSL